MKVYNEDKTQILENYDLNKGYLVDDKIFVKYHPPQEEVLPEYSIKFVRDEDGEKKAIRTEIIKAQPKHDGYDEYEDIKVYIPFNQEQLYEKYKARVDEMIREKYSLSDELAIIRQKDTKPAEFAEYNAYAESCKASAKLEFGIY